MADSSPVSPNGDINENPSQNPNPNPSPPPSPHQTPIPARKSERKRKIREFPEMSHPRKIQTVWSDSDEISLLKAAKEFRERTGSEPKGPTMKEFFEEVKGSIGDHLDQEKVYYKIRRLKSKYLILGGSPPTGAHEKALYQLSADVWGDDKPRAVDGDKDKNENNQENMDINANTPIQTILPSNKTDKDKHPFLTVALTNHYKANPNCFSKTSLDKGLKQMDASGANELERKWRKQLEADMRFKMKKHELIKEVYALLIDGVKGQVS